MRMTPADLARARIRELLSVRLGGSFGDRSWEVKLDISQQKAQEPDMVQPDAGHAGIEREPTPVYTDYQQVSSAGGPTWFQKMDRNHDGDVSSREFLGPRDEFHRLDADGDGLIDATEARRPRTP